MRVREVKTWKQARGKKELIKYLKGGSLTWYEAIKAKCYYCMEGYAEQKESCYINSCPLYGYMPYRKRLGCLEIEKQKKIYSSLQVN